MVQIYSFPALILILALTFSCKKNTEDNKPVDNTQKNGKCYVLRAYDPEYEFKITYTAAMRPELLDFTENGQSAEAYKFMYDNNGRITGYDFLAENKKIYVAVFFYNSDSTISSVVAKGETENGPVEQIHGYLYNTQKQLVRVNEYRENSSTDIDNYQLYTYDAKGNIIKTEEYQSNSSGEEPAFRRSSEYEYDNYKNPMRELNLPVFVNDELMDMSPNNVTKETYKDSEGKVTSTTKYEYTYNAQGYPLTDKSIEDSGNTYTYSLDYNCK